MNMSNDTTEEFSRLLTPERLIILFLRGWILEEDPIDLETYLIHPHISRDRMVEDLAGLSVQWHGGQQVGNWWPYIEYACIYMSPNGHMSFGLSRSN